MTKQPLTLITAITIGAYISSCSHSTTEQHAEIVETDKRVELPIAQDAYLYSRCYRYHQTKDTEYISFATSHHNRDYDEIIFFNLDSAKESHRIPIYKRGANSIDCGIGGYDIVSMDTIVLTNKYEPKLFFANRGGELICKYQITNEHCTTNSMLSLINEPYVIWKDSIIEFPQALSPIARDDFKFSDYPIAYLINTETGAATKSQICFPNLYENNGNTNHSECYSRIFDGKNFVYGFLKYDSLIVTSDHKTAQTYCAKSRYIGDVKNLGVPQGTSIPDIMRKLSTMASYGNLIYDPYREVYYRFCYFENDYPGPYTLEYTLSGGAFTIMIIDKEFNVIGETVFPDKHYASKIFFVNKDGLWLSENHFLCEDMTDDKLVFRCLQLKYN